MISRFLLFLSVVFLGIGQIWGQTTVIYDFSAGDAVTGLNANPPIALDANIGFSSHQNSAGTAPGIYSGQLRLYQNATKGGSIKIYAQNGVTITGVVVYASNNAGDGPAGYSVDNTTEVGTWSDGTTIYAMSNLSATDYVEFYNKGTSNSTRTYVDYFEVTYTMASSCEASNIAFTNTTVNKDLLDPSFTQTASSLNETTAITYESSDEAVATVNPSTGEVSLLGLGTTTITANQEAGTHNATDYCAGTATYELTVISTEPVLIVSTNSLSLTAFAGGASATEDITINGANLTGDIALSLTGDTNFSIDPNTLSASGGTITVTYTPSASPATHSATLTVSNGALSEVIALSGVTDEMPAIGCFEENFNEITAGNSTDSNGSNLAWEGNDNFPTVDRAYQAGGAVRLGAGSNVGSITSVPLTDYVGQNVTVSFSSKAWGTASTSILVSFGTQSKIVNLPAASVWTDGLSEYEITFENIEENAELKFESNSTSSEKRFFIDNISVCINGPSIPTPTLTTSVTELSDFVYGLDSGPSASQSFELSGINLDGSGDITLLADTDFEISLNDVDYFEEETLSAYDGTATDIYVRLKSGLTVGNYSGIILIGGYGTDAEVSLSGEVTAPIGSYFRSQADGNWTNNATWESSADGLSWADATTYPGASAESVVILADHTVNLNSPAITITNTEVIGAIQVLNSNYSVDGDEDIELTIKSGGEFIVNGSGYKSSGTSFGLIETGGKVIARNIPEVSGAGSDFVERYLKAFEGLFYFADGGICEWDCTTTTLGTQGFSTIFAPFDTGDIAILRFTSAPPSDYTMGSGANTVFNAFLELTNGIEINISGSGQKTFVGGIRGEGIVDVYSTSGNINLGTTSVIPEMGGNILLRIPTAKLKLPNGANVTTDANFVIERSDNTAENGSIDRQGGILNINGTLDITNMRITNTAPGGVFVKDGGTLRTRHTGGLFGDSSAIVNATNFTMETGSTIDYYATEDQTISTGKEYYHLILSGGGIKTPQSQSPINFYTIDSIQYGSITITENPIVDFSGNNLGPTALNHVNFNMDGGRLILGTGGTQPNMRGAYNLSGGVIEFANSSASGQTIRSTNAYSYQNIEVTGNSVGTSGGNLVLNENGTFVVKPNGIFKINTNSIVGPEGNQTIEIEGNGTFRTGNADGFSGGDGTSNPGQTTSIRNNIENIILHPNSIVEYSSSSDQTITNGIVTTPSDAHYENLRISGSGVKTTALGNLVVNEITYVDAATLRVAETNDDVAPNVLTARKGIQVVSGATALFENNANLMQDDGAINTGTIIVHRESKPMVRQDATGWSSPVSGQNVRNFSPGTLINRFYIYNGYNMGANGSHFKGIFEDTENYPMPQTIPEDWPHDGLINGNQFDPATYTFKPGWGYSIRVKNNHTSTEPGESVTGIFTGTPHNGSYTVPAYGKYTMVGNPYPSAIEIDKFFTGNTDVDAIHVWTHVYPTSDSENYNSNYSTITRLGGGGNTVPGSSPMNDNIAIGQGFVVEDSSRPETTDTLWTINFNNGMRVADRGIFQRNIETTEKHRFWLNVYDITTDLSIAQVLLGYMTGATNDYDHQLDGRRMGSAPLYSLIDEEKYTVQARALPFSEEDIIPLGISPIVFGKYKIEIDRVDGLFDEGQEIYLKDNYLQTLHNLSLDGGYEFEAEVGEFHDRFEIVFKPEEVMETIESELNNLLVYHSGENLVIESKKERILSVELYDLNGKSVHRKEKVNAHIYQIRRMSLATQVLIVKVLTEDGEILSKKIINQ